MINNKGAREILGRFIHRGDLHVYDRQPNKKPSTIHVSVRATVGIRKKSPVRSDMVKGITQIDYIVAAGVFIVVFALVVQFTSNYFSNIGDKTTVRIMTDQAEQLLDVTERGFEPLSWPYDSRNDSLILALHLDNSTLDSSQYGHNGTISGANCSAAVVGRFRTGCSFDGINDLISIPAMNINFSEITIMAWVNGDYTDPYTGIIQSGDAPQPIGIGYRDTTGQLTYIWNNDSQATYDFESNLTIPVRNWSFVALSLNASRAILYMSNSSGLFNATNSIAHEVQYSGTELRIAHDNCCSGRYFNGSIDDVLIYNRSLSGNEIYNHWAYENLLDKIGLMSKAYKLYIIVNNTAQFWKVAQPVETITTEKVTLNYTDLGYTANVPSTIIYEENGSVVPYNINGKVITFSTSITAGASKYFTVYFDDDSNFPERSATISGVDNITETVGHVQAFPLVQYNSILLLNNSNYTRVMNATGMPRDFSIRLLDLNGATILNFGPPPPPSGNVISFQRYTLYQNGTGHIRRGRLSVQTW